MFYYGFEYYWYAKRPLFGKKKDESLRESVVEYRKLIDEFAGDPEQFKLGLDVCVQGEQ